MHITMRDVNTAFQRCAAGRHPSYVVRANRAANDVRVQRFGASQKRT
jgi:hypothetical protein